MVGVCPRRLPAGAPRLDAVPDPFAVSAFFLRPTAAGPVLVTTEIAVLDAASPGRGALSQNGVETVRDVATFASACGLGGRDPARAEKTSWVPEATT